VGAADEPKAQRDRERERQPQADQPHPQGPIVAQPAPHSDPQRLAEGGGAQSRLVAQRARLPDQAAVARQQIANAIGLDAGSGKRAVHA
jgi:hypothetical protein